LTGPNNQPLARAVKQLLQVAPREPRSLLRVATPDYLSCGPVRGLSLFRAMTRYPVVERLGEVTAPTLIVIGERDPLVDLERMGSAVSVLDRLTAVSMPGANALNHSPPEELAALIVEFLDDRPVGGVDVDGLRVLAGS
jgi:pimeloyl-ACP methyl ester carboxylesterase